MNPIKFGTSGWRAVICEDFTFVNVKRVVQAIASYLISKGSIEKGVVVGNDSRFFGERFSKEAVKVFAANGIHSYLCKGETPTPTDTRSSELDWASPSHRVESWLRLSRLKATIRPSTVY